jgi:hypothetical protein
VTLLRIIHAGSLCIFNMRVLGHTMTIVDIDGHPIQPVNVTDLEMSSGQRYSVILNPLSPVSTSTVSEFWMEYQWRWGIPLVSHSILRYVPQTIAPPPPSSGIALLSPPSPAVLPRVEIGWIVDQFRPWNNGSSVMSAIPAPTKEIVLFSQEIISGTRVLGAARWNQQYQAPVDATVLQVFALLGFVIDDVSI